MADVIGKTGWFDLTVEDLEKSAASCREIGGKVLIGPKSMGNSKICVNENPNGSVAALYQP